MAYTEDALKSRNVKELRELCISVGAPNKGKKDELIAAILASQAADGGADENGVGLDDGAGLEDVGEDLEDPGADGTDAPAADGAAAAAAPAGKHSAIVFNLQRTGSPEKKANIVGVATLSDAERAQLRAAKFGGSLSTKVPAPKTKGGNGAAAGKAAAAGSSGVGGRTLEEEIKVLERGVKYGKATEADKDKLEGLKRKFEAQQQKQRIALDKVELMDPEKLAARQAKFGKPLLTAGSKDLKDPEAMKKRAAKFGKPLSAPVSHTDDEARKKARLQRFSKE